MYADYFTPGDGGGLTNPYSPTPARLAVDDGADGGARALAPRLAALGMLGLTAGLAGAAPVHAHGAAARHLHVVEAPVDEAGWAAAEGDR